MNIRKLLLALTGILTFTFGMYGVRAGESRSKWIRLDSPYTFGSSEGKGLGLK